MEVAQKLSKRCRKIAEMLVQYNNILICGIKIDLRIIAVIISNNA